MIARKLLILNFIAVVGTVIHHASDWIITDIFFWWPEISGKSFDLNSSAGQLTIFLLRAIDAVAIVAVPIFLMITGYTVTKVISNQVSLKTNYKIIFGRLRNILIPYLIWSTVWIIYRIWQGEVFSATDLGILLLRGRAANEYYYISVLFQIYLLTPFWIRLTRKYPLLTLSVAMIFNLIARLPVYLYQLLTIDRVWWLDIFVDWHLPTYLIWFTCGLIFGFRFETLYAWIIDHRKQIYLATAFTLAVVVSEVSWFSGQMGKPMMYSNMLISSQLFAPLVAMTMVSLNLEKLPYPKMLMRFGVQSLGIYLMHSLVNLVAAKGIYHVFPPLLGYPFVFFLFLVVVGVGIPLIAMKLVDLTPLKRYSFILFG